VSWIVLDASITLSWCFPDEQTPASMGVLELLQAGDQALVPAFWCSEVLNSMLVGERKGRISAEQTRAFLQALSALRPTLDNASLQRVFENVQALCRQHGLASYDALYVELAMRSGSPLATLDKSQREAALAVGVTCL
jgi:predicted nucleic acid-binding protein